MTPLSQPCRKWGGTSFHSTPGFRVQATNLGTGGGRRKVVCPQKDSLIQPKDSLIQPRWGCHDPCIFLSVSEAVQPWGGSTSPTIRFSPVSVGSFAPFHSLADPPNRSVGRKTHSAIPSINHRRFHPTFQITSILYLIWLQTPSDDPPFRYENGPVLPVFL